MDVLFFLLEKIETPWKHLGKEQQKPHLYSAHPRHVTCSFAESGTLPARLYDVLWYRACEAEL